ncbi:MAG TPA: DUF1326 domain-containing protein [Thermoleophilaceae bacterium]|nr:DUF1326 domain-containing protein [Thermoleophilaceae bacterium]
MAWRMSGTYVASCNCQLLCPCPTDGPPTAPDGHCRGIGVFQIREGSLDDTDLSGTAFALVNLFPSNISSGNWKLGVVVDEGASDEQAGALGRILHGEEGGLFAEFAPLVEEWLGVERAAVSLSDGDAPSAQAGEASLRFEPLEGPGGGHTTVKNAIFGFAPEYRVGHAPGHSNWFGLDFDGVYGESADFEFASEMAEEAPRGRG